MEIETKMAEDKQREVDRLSKETNGNLGDKQKPSALAVKRIAKQGAVRRPLTPRIGRGF